MSGIADSIRRGLEEAVTYARGEADASRYRVHVPPEVNVRAIRAMLDMTQEEFAAAFTVPIGMLRDWEQHRKQPDAPARALLRVIEREPEAVRRALAG